MKQFSFGSLLMSAAMGCLFISCGSGKSKTEATTDSTATESNVAATNAVVNTIVTTPENNVLVVHKVANYSKWKMAYDAGDSLRLASGIHNYVVGRGTEDSNMVLVAVKIDDIAKAKAFVKNPALKQAMQKGGVMGKPDFQFMTSTWQDTVNVGTVPRVLITFTVKDWDVFQKKYLDGKQHRDENGLAARVAGHDADDNKKVFLVTALMDVEKAKAFWNSDALKKIREEAGVTSESKRFTFTIVQRY